MKFKWDEGKDKLQRNKYGVGFEEVKDIFTGSYFEMQKNDDPEQYLVVGWCGLSLFTAIYEEREDLEGSFYWLVTFWHATKTERKLYEEG